MNWWFATPEANAASATSPKESSPQTNFLDKKIPSPSSTAEPQSLNGRKLTHLTKDRTKTASGNGPMRRPPTSVRECKVEILLKPTEKTADKPIQPPESLVTSMDVKDFEMLPRGFEQAIEGCEKLSASIFSPAATHGMTQATLGPMKLRRRSIRATQ